MRSIFAESRFAQLDRELSPARYDVDDSRFRLHKADCADLMACFCTHCLTNCEDFLGSGRESVLPAIHRRGARMIGETVIHASDLIQDRWYHPIGISRPGSPIMPGTTPMDRRKDALRGRFQGSPRSS